MPTVTIHALQENMVVEFDYQPAERQTWEHPGCDESIDITSVTINGVDVCELITNLDGWSRVEELVIEAYHEAQQDERDDIEVDLHFLRRAV